MYPLSKDKETTLREALQKLRSDEQYADIILRGSDGVEVRANRAVLAARSGVFDKMLYGDFKEASKQVVDIGYDGRVLALVVEYIFTDTNEILEGNEASSSSLLHYAKSLASTIDAAVYFELPDLYKTVVATAQSSMEKNPPLCGPLFALSGLSPLSEVENAALAKIREDPKLLLNDGSIQMFSSSRLAVILKDQRLNVAEIELFDILQKWADSCTEDQPDGANSRKRKASELTANLKLEWINPKDLSSVVASSGLVTEKQLLDAYKSQALKLSEMHPYIFRGNRGETIWKQSSDAVFFNETTSYKTDTVNRRLHKGINKWKIKIEEKGSDQRPYIYVGVVASHHKLCDNVPLGGHSGGWGYANDGDTKYGDEWGGGSYEHRAFRASSEITLVLDLTGAGTLSASVDGGPTHQLFNNMLSQLEKGKSAPWFYPAASMEKGRIRFLGFECCGASPCASPS